MAYTTPDIITWSTSSQPLALYGEDKRQHTTGGTIDPDLHMKIYVERKSLEWQYAQDPTDADGILYGQGNYVYALCFPYILESMQISGSGGQVVNGTSPLVPPAPLEFIVSSSSYITDGSPDAHLTGYEGWNILFIRNSVIQSTIDTGGTYYSWDSTNAIIAFYYNGITSPLVLGDLIQIYPVI